MAVAVAVAAAVAVAVAVAAAAVHAPGAHLVSAALRVQLITLFRRHFRSYDLKAHHFAGGENGHGRTSPAKCP